MNTTAKIGIFLLVALAQLYVPASMIWQHENTLKNGALFKFKCEPIDPYDPFRGRYVWLGFQQNSIPLPSALQDTYRSVCVTIDTGDDGFARIADVTREKPDTPNYFRATMQYGHLQYPFDRFYMDEFTAPQAEIAYRESLQADLLDTYVTVRVHNGQAVLEDLYLNNVPVNEYLQTFPKK